MKARYEQRGHKTEAGVSVTDYLDLANLPHWHTEHELIFVLSGSAEVMINNTLYILAEKSAAFISSEDIHYIRSSANGMIRVIKLDNDLLKPITEKHSLVTPVIENSYPIYDISSEIKHELRTKEQNYAIISDCTALKLIAEIFRREAAMKCTSQTDNADPKYKELLRLISARYAFITFEEAASFMCLSQPYFSKYFHHMSGMTFTRYLNTVKVSAACELLAKGSLSVTETAAACGFGTIRSFNRVFKEITGTVPTAVTEKTLIIRSENSDIGFNPTLSCSVQLD